MANKITIPKELHDELHRQNLYNRASLQGAEVAFGWLVNNLCRIPFNEACGQLTEWWSELNPDKKAKK